MAAATTEDKKLPSQLSKLDLENSAAGSSPSLLRATAKPTKGVSFAAVPLPVDEEEDDTDEDEEELDASADEDDEGASREPLLDLASGLRNGHNHRAPAKEEGPYDPDQAQTTPASYHQAAPTSGQSASGSTGWRPLTDTFLVVDVECTCEVTPWSEPAPGLAGERGEMVISKAPSSRAQAKKLNRDYPNEIIEFPIVMLQWSDEAQEYVIADTYHSFVKPIWRPQLSRFCRDLTGIRQSQLTDAPTWPQVEGQVYRFLRKHELLDNPMVWGDFEDGSEPEDKSPNGSSAEELSSFDRTRFKLRRGVAWVTHGLADLQSFVPKQTFISAREPRDVLGKRFDQTAAVDGKSPLAFPLWLRGPLMEVRKSIAWLEFLGVHNPSFGHKPSTRDVTIEGLLRQMGLPPFEGRLHSGLDDARNIARLVIELGKRVRDVHVGVEIPTHELKPKKKASQVTDWPTVPPPSKADDPAATDEQRIASAAAAAAEKKKLEGNDEQKKDEEEEPPLPPGHPHAKLYIPPGVIPAARTKARKPQRRMLDRVELERAVLGPNTDVSSVADKKWSWQGKKSGAIHWPHPQDPTSFEKDEEE